MLRGQAYHWLLSALFLLLTAAFTLRLLQPDWHVAGLPLHRLLRYMAWALAVVTIPTLIVRLIERLRRRGDPP